MTVAPSSYAVVPTTQQLLDKLHEGLAGNADAKKKLCQKGNLSGSIGKLFTSKGKEIDFSLRAGNGTACSIKQVAQLAEKLCVGEEGYDKSQCHTKALVAIAK
jgi:hypothetical protein